MPGNYSHTNLMDGEVLTANKYNADHQNHITNATPQGLDDYSATVAQMQTTTDPGEVGTENLPTSTAGELERIRQVLQEIKGTPQWYVSQTGVRMTGQAYAEAALPAAGEAGRLALVTDSLRGLALDTGVQWRYLSQNRISLRDFGCVFDGDSAKAATNLSGFHAAIAALPSSGGAIVLETGTLMVSGTITVNKPLLLVGAGRDITIIKSTVDNLPVFSIISVSVRFEKFTVDRAVQPIAGGDGLVTSSTMLGNIHFEEVHVLNQYNGWNLGPVSWGVVMDCSAAGSEQHGFQFTPGPTSGIMQWYAQRCLSQQNKGQGFRQDMTIAGLGPWLFDCSTFANDQGGYVFSSSGTGSQGLLVFNSCISSNDNRAGLAITTAGGPIILRDCWVESTGRLTGVGVGYQGATIATPSNTGHGITVGSAVNAGNAMILGGFAGDCSFSGVYNQSPRALISNVMCTLNGQALSADLRNRAHVYSSGIGTVISHCAFNAPGNVQKYVVFEGTGYDGTALPGCTFDPTLSVANWVDTSLVVGSKTPGTTLGGLRVSTDVVEFILSNLVNGKNLYQFCDAFGNWYLANTLGMPILAVSDAGQLNVYTTSLKPVTEGAADSGGAGYRVLRVPNESAQVGPAGGGLASSHP